MLILMTVLTITMVITIVGKDIDECTVQDVCPDNSECKNNQGGFHCNCADGYQGDYCSDIDECNSTTSCHENADCLNTDGSYTCSCKDGFYGNGDSCFPGQCLDNYCPENQKCISTTTTGCKCKDGFQFSNESVCEDVDECEQIKCGDQAGCFNTIGSYACRDIFSTTVFTNTTFAVHEELLTTQPILTETNTTLTTLTFTTDMSTKQAILATTKSPFTTSFK